ncbi:hypothetical protein LQF12_12160 [Ruania suaedae]|uniref:hypothetical protein n=1 Tax=Ruania suaedae TaxID=2897774 RepID=UPI001E2ABE53|nr:hypothetical protein [Ruania suaedae]UFU02255.1 hypothetical protein LQF12_12160 [Ruania suaedae]
MTARIRLLLVALLAMTLPVSGCQFVQDQAGDVVEHAIEEAVAGLDLTDGVPESFPSGVPLVEGPARGASRSTDTGTEWVVLIEADDQGEAAQEAVEGAGFEEKHAVSTEAGLMAEYSDGAHHLTLIASGTRVVYVIRGV